MQVRLSAKKLTGGKWPGASCIMSLFPYYVTRITSIYSYCTYTNTKPTARMRRLHECLQIKTLLTTNEQHLILTGGI